VETRRGKLFSPAQSMGKGSYTFYGVVRMQKGGLLKVLTGVWDVVEGQKKRPRKNFDHSGKSRKQRKDGGKRGGG